MNSIDSGSARQHQESILISPYQCDNELRDRKGFPLFINNYPTLNQALAHNFYSKRSISAHHCEVTHEGTINPLINFDATIRWRLFNSKDSYPLSMIVLSNSLMRFIDLCIFGNEQKTKRTCTNRVVDNPGTCLTSGGSSNSLRVNNSKCQRHTVLSKSMQRY